MEEEPDQQKTSETYYVHSKDGDYTVSKEEQEAIKFLIEHNLERFFCDDECKDDQEPIPEQKESSQVSMEEDEDDNDNDEEVEEYVDSSVEEEMNQNDNEGPVLNILENNIKLDGIYALTKYLKNEFEKEDVNLETLKYINTMILSTTLVKYKRLINYYEETKIKNSVIEEFCDFDKVFRLFVALNLS